MIRWLTRRPLAEASPWRWLLHPDPERLGELACSLAAPHAASEEVAAQFSRVVSSIRVGAIHKQTRSGRLRECDAVLAELLRARRLHEVRFLDVGASDGTTTLDTVEFLSAQLALPIRATLLDRYVRLLRHGAGLLVEYRMPDGAPVMVRVGPAGLQLSSVESTRDPLSRWLGRAWLRAKSRRALPLAATLELVSPAVRRAGIRVLEANVLEPQAALAGAFDAIRASNVLNLDYFGAEGIARVLRHLHGYLGEEGILVVSRNQDEEGGVERGSAWRRTESGFARLRDFGGGSYVAALVDELRVSLRA